MKSANAKSASRRGFLGSLATGAAGLGLAALASPAELMAGSRYPALSPEDPENWFSKIKGRHRIIFDAPVFNNGMPVVFPRVFQLSNQAAGTPLEDLGIVVVFRHEAFALALNSDMWAKYKLGDHQQIKDPATGSASARNFFWKPKAGDVEIPGSGIDQLEATGVLFCVCQMALMYYSGVIAKKMGMDANAVLNEWKANLLPNIQIVPSGVYAVNRAQEHQCTYCFAG